MYVHLADSGAFSYHKPAGLGNIDFPAVFNALHAVGYDGYVTVDYGGVPADQILAEVKKGREYFVRCLAAMT
jgi:sugar phosphate isomerase/epimerase